MSYEALRAGKGVTLTYGNFVSPTMPAPSIAMPPPVPRPAPMAPPPIAPAQTPTPVSGRKLLFGLFVLWGIHRLRQDD